MSTVFMWRSSDQIGQDSIAMCCPVCECELTLHQPDPQLADRLLATCDECKSWFLANSDGVVLGRLPEFPDNATRRRSSR
jgi:hypothetical protein